MGCREKRPVDAPAGNCGHLAQGLVEMRLGPLLASRRFPTGAEGGGLSLLCGAEGPSRLQRPCLQVTRRGGPVAPGPQREPDTGNGNGQQPPQGLVAVSPGPCMEGSGLLPHGGAEMRLSGLRRIAVPVRLGAGSGRSAARITGTLRREPVARRLTGRRTDTFRRERPDHFS